MVLNDRRLIIRNIIEENYSFRKIANIAHVTCKILDKNLTNTGYKLCSYFRGHRFGSIDTRIKNLLRVMKKFHEEEFKSKFRGLEKTLRKHIALEENNFDILRNKSQF